MDFPVNWPDFTKGQRRRLNQFGVTDEQVWQLRFSLPIIRNHVSAQARPTAIRDRLKEIETLAKQLSRKLLAVDKSTDQAIALLDCRFWLAAHQRLEGDPEAILPIGTHVSHHYVPELHDLVDAAKAALTDVSKGRRGRPGTASSLPVKAVDDALRNGWVKTNTGQLPVAMYPEALKPSSAENSPFRIIVGICYQAVGGTDDPLRAIRAFLAQERTQRSELLAGLDAALLLESSDATRIARKGMSKRKRN